MIKSDPSLSRKLVDLETGLVQAKVVDLCNLSSFAMAQLPGEAGARRSNQP